MKLRLVMSLLFGVSLAASAVRSQHPEPSKTVEKTIDVSRRTQRRQDEWADEKSDLMVRYRNASANVKYLEERIAIESEKADGLDERVAELERRLDESTRLRSSLQDTLDAVFGRLESQVSDDLPFLVKERQARLRALDKELSRPDVTGAEKLRRLLEALQIETAYGSTVEVVQDRIAVGSDTLFVDLLRLGRVALFWRTPDGERTGEYDIATGTWTELPEKYHRSIRTAMDMAARIRPVEITELPLGRITR
jgi:hypothetical protein